MKIVAPTALALLAAACAQTKETVGAPLRPTSATPFAAHTALGVADLAERAKELCTATERMVAALENRDLDAARRAYVDARAPYEEIEVLRAAFPDLHRSIDVRPADLPQGERDDDFRGFHRIEVLIFSRLDHEAALPYAERLLDDVYELKARLADPSLFDAELAFEGMIRAAGEIASRTITSEEETWSDATLTVVRHRWMGIHALYRHFAGSVREVDAVVAEQLNRSYRQALEQVAQDFPLDSNMGTPYTLVDRGRRRGLADASLTFQHNLRRAAEALDLDS